MYCLSSFSRSFMVLGLTFKSLIHFEFIFSYGVRKCSSFILLHISVQFSQHYLLNRLHFLHCISLPPLSKIKLFASFIWRSIPPAPILIFLQLHSNLIRKLIPRAPFFFFKISLVVWSLLCFHTHYDIFNSISVKNTIGSLTGIALNL